MSTVVSYYKTYCFFSRIYRAEYVYYRRESNTALQPVMSEVASHLIDEDVEEFQGRLRRHCTVNDCASFY
jgi:hypothetical protein